MNPILSLLRPGLAAAALGATLLAQGLDPLTTTGAGHQRPYARSKPRPHAEGKVADRLLQDALTQAPDRLVFDAPGDGRLWAAGETYKASFGAEGFVYIPFLGSDAPRNFPVQFVLRSVRVAGRDVAFDACAPATRAGARVTFDRGLVREVYDLTPRSVEQTFVVEGALPGDVDLEIEVTSDLVEDAAQAGLQWRNHLGQVDYGTAYVVCGTEKREIASAVFGRTLRLHVPASKRGSGPVVIDPILTTRQLTPTQRSSEIPDVAYDATTDRWAVTWVHLFSATDHDVVAELRTGNGDPIAGTFKVIDLSTDSYSWPRIANLNRADRFLIAMERYRPQDPPNQQFTVWGRTLDAVAPFSTSALIPISPASTADQLSVDVGGDSGNGTRWTVVWRHGNDIHARQVFADASLASNTIPIESTSAACISPQISLSNGNGLTGRPCWCIVYSLWVSDTNWDVYGAVLDNNGVILAPHSPIHRASTNDPYTYVSSPLTDAGPVPAFLVSYERQVSPPEMMAKVIDANFATVVPEVNLTRRYGFSGIYCRVESDGIRFAASCQIGTTMRIGTLAMVAGDLVLHETLQDMGTGDSPAIASRRSGGGAPTEYGVVFDTTNAPARATLVLYQGRAPAGGVSRRSTNCGLGINYNGRPFLGEQITFTLTNTGSDLPGFVVGFPAPALQLCGNCNLGLDLTKAMIPFPAPMSLVLPRDPIFVGATLSAQGYAIGSGACFGGLRVSDTYDLTIQ
jgi:hypothetical protein